MLNIANYLLGQTIFVLILSNFHNLCSAEPLPETIGDIEYTFVDSQTQNPALKEGLVVETNFGNPIHGFRINMKDKASVGYKALFYGEARCFLKIPFVEPIDASRRFLLAKPWTKDNSKKPIKNQPTKTNQGITEEELLGKLNSQSKTEAIRVGPACKQIGFNKPNWITTGREDCLTLNVFAPPDNGTHPVYVHFNAGALAVSSAAEIGYKGLIRNLVSRGIVVVTFNYRLSFLEVFSKEEVEALNADYARQNKPSPYKDYRINLGLEDAIMALEWVKRNIKNFGGDPNKITVGGNSAGAAMVEMIMLALNRRGTGFNLFNQVAIFGGSADLSTKFSRLAQDLDKKRKEQACTKSGTVMSGDELWQCLRKPELDLAWLDRQDPKEEKRYLTWSIKTPDVKRFEDVARGVFKSWTPEKTIPIFMATSRDEWATYDSLDFKVEAAKHGIKQYGLEYLVYVLKIILKPYEMLTKETEPFSVESKAKSIAESLIETYKEELSGILANKSNPTEEDFYKIIMKIFTDKQWAVPQLDDALKFVEKGHTVYMLRFGHEMVTGLPRENPLKEKGVRMIEHGQESRYFLMHEKHWGLKDQFKNVHELAVADRMGEMLANFVRDGNPQELSCLNKIVSSIPLVRNIPCFGNGKGPHYFELTSKHPDPKKPGDKIEVTVATKEKWLSDKVVKHWCDFFRSYGQAPFTVNERNKEMKEPMSNTGMCAIKA
ncbi:carboxylesterase family domain-containing protein [Ditylenchus destructor]|nr:carboxylesterase family domain-containing protein [Ditylenchus destructor]